MKKKVTNLSLKIFTLFVISISLSINSNAQGNALNFDGINDYVPIGPSTGLYNAGAYAYTKEAWVLFLPVAQAQNIVSSYDPFFIEYDFHLNASNNFVIPGNVHIDVRDPNEMDIAHWNHVAVTYDGVSTMKLYKNGVLVNTNTSAPACASLQNYIGGFFDQNSLQVDYFYTGPIDEVKVYKDTALELADIQFDMLHTASAIPSKLVAYYNFNVGTAGGTNTGLTTLPDLSGNGYNGTLTNFALTGTSSNWVESYAMVVPSALAATNTNAISFSANWTTPGIGIIDNYIVDVSTTADFTNPVAGSPFTVAFGTNTLSVTGLSALTTYYYRVIADKASMFGRGAFSNIISVTTTGLLPVNLLSFNVNKTSGANMLQWTTVSEVNSRYFELQRSENGNNFTTIATINSNGNSSNIKTYQYTDNLSANQPPVYYYRLKLVDINGSFTYSSKILIKNTKGGAITIYPNPAQEKIIVNITDKTLMNTAALLSDINGKLLQRVLINQTATPINISSYAKGMYVLKLANGESIKVFKD